MSKRMTWILVVAAVLVCAAAAATWYSGQPESAPEKQAALFPKLGDDLNDMTSVRLSGPADHTVTLQRAKDDWVVAERGDYPADIGNLRSFMLGLADAKLMEGETRKKANYHYLGVQDISKPDAAGVLVQLRDADGKVLDSVIVGNKAKSRGRYVRKPGDARSWLAQPMPDVPLDPAKWLDHDLINIGPDQVHRVDVTPHDGKAFAVEKASPTDGMFKLVEPTGKKLGHEAAANPLGRSLASLRFTDVEPAAKARDELANADHLRYEMFNGWVVDLRVAKEKKGVSATAWHVSFDPKLAQRFLKDEDAKGKKSSDSILAENRKKAEKLAARLNGRVFTMPNYTADRFHVTLAKLTKASSQ